MLGAQELQETLAEYSDVSSQGVMLADGFEDALVGYVQRFDFETPVALYDWDACLRILVERDGMSPEGAQEFFEYNTLGAWMGPGTPCFARLLPPAHAPAEMD